MKDNDKNAWMLNIIRKNYRGSFELLFNGYRKELRSSDVVHAKFQTYDKNDDLFRILLTFRVKHKGKIKMIERSYDFYAHELELDTSEFKSSKNKQKQKNKEVFVGEPEPTPHFETLKDMFRNMKGEINSNREIFSLFRQGKIFLGPPSNVEGKGVVNKNGRYFYREKQKKN